MENEQIYVYILSATWKKGRKNRTPEYGSTILAVECDVNPLKNMLCEIIKEKAKTYLGVLPTKGTAESIEGGMAYRIQHDESFAEFRISGHNVNVTENVLYKLIQKVESKDRRDNIEDYLTGLFESGNLEGWRYEYMIDNPAIINKISHNFDRCESCEVPYNSTMDVVCKEAADEILLNDETIKFLWNQLADVSVDDDGCTEQSFMHYQPGTDREEIWKWFDKHYSSGVATLMYGYTD